MRVEESGSFEVDATPGAALAYLSDVEAVPHSLPGEVRGVDARDDGGVTVELTASHAGASEDVRLRFYVDAVDEDAGRVAYTGHGLGSRVKVDLDGEFTVEGAGDGARVEWRGAADVGGLLSSLNRGVTDAAVREKLAEAAENVRLALGERAAD